MGDRADEFVFHLLRLFQPLGHLIDGAAQAVHLVPLVTGHRQADIQFSPGDAGGDPLHLPQRHHDAPHKVQAGGHCKAQNGRHHDQTDDENALQLRLHQRQTGDKAHGSHVLGRIGHQTAHGHDRFPAGGAVDGHTHAVRCILRLVKIVLHHDAVRTCAAG